MSDEVTAFEKPLQSAMTDINEEDDLRDLSSLVNGCRNDPEGIETKKHIVRRHVSMKGGSADLLAVLCNLHKREVLQVPPQALFSALKFQPAKGGKAGGGAHDPGHFLATALAACDSKDSMAGVVGAYIASNPKLDQVALFAYVNDRGFVEYDAEEVIRLVTWVPPDNDGGRPAAWKVLWGLSEPIPTGAPWYATIRDARGRRANLAFLGSVLDDGTAPSLAPPSEVMGTWKVQKPAMCITVDAGSMHPRQLDSINRMANLPQFHEWVAQQTGDGGKKSKADSAAVATAPPVDGAEGRRRALLTKFKLAGLNVMGGKGIKLKALLHLSMKQWRDELPSVDTDEMLGDGSINNIIFTKVKEVFAALLDAAVLAGNWVIVDRTDGSGSATAELLLEMALERITTKPVILVIDSLERLGKARDGSRSIKIIQQLHDIFMDDEVIIQGEPIGGEKLFTFDYKYTPDECAASLCHTPRRLRPLPSCARLTPPVAVHVRYGRYYNSTKFANIPDAQLPFAVIKEHQRKAYNNTCDPNRKWRYVYVDGIFSAGTHIVIKNNDTDSFDIEEAGTPGFLYAHGDSRTYKRLRSNIQQGRPIVMLHNSGGVVMAFSWLQRVMAFQRPPPDTQELGGPLRYLVANLSEANWTNDFGVPEMLMMRALAERAPMLFRKNVVSVDILTESEEQVLEVITGCFAQAGGVPELGLGNAEVNVIFTTWMLHLTLCENARRFHRRSVVFQWLFWLLSINATAVAVVDSSIGSGVLSWALPITPEFVASAGPVFAIAVTIIPIVSALVVTILSRMKWRDKWSTCIMCADTLASEIYKFRMQTCEYDQSKPPGKDENGDDLPPLTVKEKARRARSMFVDRVQAFHQACITELSQSSSLKPTRAAKGAKVAPTMMLVERNKRDEKPSLAQWYKLKVHCEQHFYRARWAFPLGISFLTWISGLRPYLSQRAMRDEMLSVIQTLSESGQVVLKGTTPLSERESKLIRQTLSASLGLPKNMFDGVRDEIRVLQRKVVVQLAKESEKEKAGKVNSDEEAGAVEEADAGALPVLAVQPGSRMMSPRGMMTKGGADRYKALPKEEQGTVEAVRELVMEMQGLGKPNDEDGKAVKAAKTRVKKVSKATNTVDDDYLAGPISIDSYMCYRVRPVIEMLEKKANKLSWRLAALEISGFMIQSFGSVLGAAQFTEWVALTVALAAVLQGFIEFVQLRNQVTSVNLALRDLQSLTVFWDSLSIVRRRTPAVKMQVVRTTEAALLMVVDAHTTASSNTITSVDKKMSDQEAEKEAAEGE